MNSAADFKFMHTVIQNKDTVSDCKLKKSTAALHAIGGLHAAISLPD